MNKPACSILAVAVSSLFPGIAAASGNGTFGIPLYLDQATYTINDYPGTDKDLPRSHATGERFCGQLKSRLNSVYPQIAVTRRADERDAAVTFSNYINGAQSGSEMVLFAGHGYTDGIQVGGFTTVSPYNKKYGGWTRFVFFDACNVLWNTDLSRYSPMFGGAHAFLGFASKTYQYIKSYDCYPWGCSYFRSEDLYDSFAAKWVNQNQFLWYAWRDGVRDTRYSRGGLGHEPVVVFSEGTVDGQTYVGGLEKVTSIYNGDVPLGPGIRLGRLNEVFGTPAY